MRSMRNVFLVGAFGVVLCLSGTGWATDALVVESKTVFAGETGVTVGVYLENAISMSGIVIPLEVRTLSGGAYMADNSMSFAAVGRVTASGVMDFVTQNYMNTPASQTCSGPISKTWRGASTGQRSNDGSPDYTFWGGNQAFGECLSPGLDPPGSPSFMFTFDINGNLGTFEIDTACAAPGGHLLYVNCNTSGAILLDFTKGIITVERAPKNAVVVESKTIAAGQAGATVDVYLENYVPLSGLVLPLEFRTVSGGAYMVDNTLQFSTSGRVAGSGLEDFPTLRYMNNPSGNTCSGPVSSTYSASGPLFNNGSPDGFLWVGVSSGPATCLPPGNDGTPGSGTPSFQFSFDVNDQLGIFEIDTCCTAPSGHLDFVDCNTSGTVPVEFTKGIVTVEYSGNDAVVVESKTVAPDETGVTVGVYIENNSSLEALVLPLEIRTVSGGAYTADNTMLLTQSGRLAGSGLIDFPNMTYFSTPFASNTCSGPVSQTWGAGSGPLSNDGSPDAIVWVGQSTTGPAGCLTPGIDAPGSPSLYFTFDINSSLGSFEIDTACYAPSGHLLYVDCNSVPVVPEFTKGVITVSDCDCTCHGDRLCDGVYNVLDVIMIVNVAMRSWPDIPLQGCPVDATDLDCDGDTDVIDVVRLVNVAFRSGDPATQICDPCAP